MISNDYGQSWRRAISGLPASGDVARFVCDPQRKSTAWCCAGKPDANEGGVAVTRDGGATWHVTGSELNGLPKTAAGLLILDIDSPADARTLYIVSYGNGIYKSLDGGRTWGPLNEGFGQQQINISDIVLDPWHPKRLYAAKQWSEKDMSGGLYVMDQGAKRWRKCNLNIELPDIRSIAIDPRYPQVMFICCCEYYSKILEHAFPGGIFRSEDSGQTWKQVLNDRAVTCLQISASGPRTIYAGTTRYPYYDNAVGRGVIVSHDGGDTWVETNKGLTNKNVIAITLDPDDPARVYVGTGGNGLFIGRWE
jgi:photosystem II stability/assembly factor-like uncharacterized protein